MNRPKKFQVIAECRAPNMGAAPIMFLMDSFSMSAEEAINHLVSPQSKREPLATGTAEVCETLLRRAAKKTSKYNGLGSDMRFLSIRTEPIEDLKAEIG